MWATAHKPKLTKNILLQIFRKRVFLSKRDKLFQKSVFPVVSLFLQNYIILTQKKWAAHMPTNTIRDTFFNHINFKTHPKHQNQKFASISKQTKPKPSRKNVRNIMRIPNKTRIENPTCLPPFTKNQPTTKLKKSNQARKHLKSKTPVFTKSPKTASESKS